jgi:hypothetical protein
VLGIKSRALYMLGKHSITELCPLGFLRQRLSYYVV